MKPFSLSLCLLILLLSACEREDRFGSALPVIFQIDQLQLRGGDTITITGNNFSENAANNRVTFNGTQALIVSSSFRDLVVIVPERAGAGQLVVTTRAGRSNEFPYRYTYQVTGVNTLDLNVEFTNFRKMKIINNQIFLISTFNDPFPDPSFTKIYRFRLDGSAVPEGLNPLQINNFNVGAIAADAQGNVVVSEARLYSLNLLQGTLSPLPNTSKVLAVGGEYDPDFGPFSDITFDRDGFLYYITVNGFESDLATFSTQAGESVITPILGEVVANFNITSTKEVLLGYQFGLIASVSQQGQFRLVFGGEGVLGGDAFSSIFRESTNEFFIAVDEKLFVLDRTTGRLENLAVLPQDIISLALSEDGRLFALTEFSEVQEVIFK